MFAIDQDLTVRIHRSGTRQYPFWIFCSLYGIYAFLLFFLGAWYAHDWNVMIFQRLVGTLLTTIVLTLLVRYTVRRPRPTFSDRAYTPLLKQFSFPSMHASVAFSLATSLACIELAGPTWTLTVPIVVGLFVLALLVSISRVMVGVHYVSDIIGGAILGSAISVVANLL